MSLLAAPALERLCPRHSCAASGRPVWPGGGLCSLELMCRGPCESQSEPAPAVLGVFIYFNCFFNIPHLMMQIPLYSLSVNVLIQIFLLIVHSAAVFLARGTQPTFRRCVTHVIDLHLGPAVFPTPWILKVTTASWIGPQSPNLTPLGHPKRNPIHITLARFLWVCAGLVSRELQQRATLDTGLSLPACSLSQS